MWFSYPLSLSVLILCKVTNVEAVLGRSAANYDTCCSPFDFRTATHRLCKGPRGPRPRWATVLQAPMKAWCVCKRVSCALASWRYTSAHTKASSQVHHSVEAVKAGSCCGFPGRPALRCPLCPLFVGSRLNRAPVPGRRAPAPPLQRVVSRRLPSQRPLAPRHSPQSTSSRGGDPLTVF